MKQIIIATQILLCCSIATSLWAQSTNWADYGLTEESVKYLSEKEKQEILSSMTPAQTQEKIRKEIQENGLEATQKKYPIPALFQEIKNADLSKNQEIVSCFDYYTFGSIEAPIQSRSSRTVSGAEITFFGDIINKNPYPVVEGTLYIKIMKNIGNLKNPNGPDVVDQFIAVDDVTLPAKGSIPFEFKWKVPAHATTGDYRVVTYFTSDKKFNLQGLSFTDDIVGNSFDFTVKGEQQEIITFDKSSVVINSNPYYFAAYPPRISKGQQVSISLDILNDTPTNQNAQIKWKLYKWDAMSPDNLVREFTTNTETKANTNTKIELRVPEESEPVYLLVGELHYQDTKSMVNIRYVRDGVDKVRLNYPAVTSYPLKQDEPTTLFTCLHNSGQSSQVLNNKVIMEVRNEKGKVLESYTYEGVVTGDMMAVKKEFTPKTTLDKFSIHASIYTDGKLVDESVMEYNCKSIDPSKCTKQSPFSTMHIILTLSALFLLTIILIFIKRKTKGVGVVMTLFIVMTSIVFFDGGIVKTQAQLPAGYVNPSITSGSSQAVWNTVINRTFYYYANREQSAAFAPALSDPNITVKYSAKITYDSGNEILNDSVVAVGTKLKLQFIPHHSYDIYWFGTGLSYDSPYGEWATDTTYPNPPGISCSEKDYTNKFGWTPTFFNPLAPPIPLENNLYIFKVYLPLVVLPPVKTITGIDGLSCGVLLGDESRGYYMNCDVTREGAIRANFNFAGAWGRFYYRYDIIKSPNSNYLGCWGNNLPVHIVNGTFPNAYFSIFELQVPAQSITYNLTAISVPTKNRAPTISIAGPTTGTVSTSYNFDLTASDPDTNKVKIEVDWDNDGIGDVFLPAGAEEYIASPITQTASKQWSTLGGKTFKARAIDEHGAMSDWSSHTITLSNAPINGSCGSAHNQTYLSTRTAYSPDVQCAQGNPSSTTFPTIGASATWTCSGQYEGQSSGPCTASITAPVDMCANIEDIQTTIPTGLTRTAGNCVCGG